MNKKSAYETSNKNWCNASCFRVVRSVSLLFTPLPLDSLPQEALADLPENALPYLTLINPTIFLIVAVLIGGSLSPKVQLGSPLIKEIILKGSFKKILFEQLRPGVTLGLFGGVFITLL